jgi:hypothetical protein
MFSTAQLTRTVLIAATVASLGAGPALARPSEEPLSAAPSATTAPRPAGAQQGTPPRVEGMGVRPAQPAASKPAGPVVPLTQAGDSTGRDWLIAGILASSTLALALIAAAARHRHKARRLRPRHI